MGTCIGWGLHAWESTILVKNVGALDTDCAKFDSHINNKHSNPPFSRSMLCVVFYTSKVLHNIDKGGRGVFGHEILHQLSKYLYGNQK